MHKKTSLLFGLTLVSLAILALVATLLIDRPGGLTASTGFSTWPLIVIGAGLLFCLPPFLFRQQRGLGGLFIPGLPVLATGILLFIASLTHDWSLWSRWWPVEVIALALGFVLAGIFLRVIWLMVPASIIGLTGLALLFSALTHQWSAWAVLWTVVPFSVGLPLLLIGIFQRNFGVRLAGIILCGFAGLAFAALLSFISSSSLVLRLVGPAVILLLGILLIVSAIVRRSDKPSVTEKTS